MASDGHTLALRGVAIGTVWILLLTTLAVAARAGEYEQIFQDLGMRELPLLTEAILPVAGAIRSFWWALALGGLALCGVVGSGRWDRALVALIVTGVLLAGLFIAATYLAVRMPLEMIQRKLGS